MADLIKSQVEIDLAVSELSSTQKQRYQALYSIYGDRTIEVITRLRRSGPNSWAKVNAKATKLHRAKASSKDYYGSLAEEIEDLKVIDDDAIIRKVTEVRSDHDLEPFLKRIKTQCLNEFSDLFMYEEVDLPEDENRKDAPKQYRILLCLLPS